MKWMKALGLFVVVLSISMIMSSKAEATTSSTLTLMDGTDTWTLTVNTGCTTCLVVLKLVTGTPSPNLGTYLDSVQWTIDNPANVMPTSAANIGFNATTAGTTSDWSFSLANLNANQCGGGSSNSACGAWVAGGTGGGFGPITNNETLTWGFNTTFASELPTTLTSGNIRAAYNNADGSNAHIFSPGGGSFDNGGPPVTVPEPSTLLLLGGGLFVMSLVARRQWGHR